MAPCREHPNELKIDQIDKKQQQGRTPQIEYLDENGPGIEVVGFTAWKNMWIPGSYGNQRYRREPNAQVAFHPAELRCQVSEEGIGQGVKCAKDQSPGPGLPRRQSDHVDQLNFEPPDGKKPEAKSIDQAAREALSRRCLV